MPERRQLSLLNLSGQDFLHQIEFTEEDVVEYYEATKDQRLSVPEERTFNEFIFPTEDSAKAAFGILAVGGDYEPAETVQKTLRRSKAEDVAIEEIRAQIFSPGIEVGAVAGPVEASGGWLVGQLVEIHPGVSKTLEETREEITAEIKAEKAELEYYAAINDIDDLIGEGRSLSEIASRFGAPTTTFSPLDARGLTEQGIFMQGIAAAPEAFRQAFELPTGQITDKFDQNGYTVLISVDGITPKTIPPYADISERVKLAYNISKEGEALKASADASNAALEVGATTMEAQAERYGSEVLKSERGLRRTALDRTLPQSVLQAAFALDEGKSIVTQGSTPTELIIVKLDRIERPEPNELDVLAPISAPKVTTQLDQDILSAFELEVQAAMEVEIKEADYLAYKQRLIDDQ